MSNVTKTYLSQIKSYKTSFDSEKSYYMNTTYNTFLSGYLNTCSDPVVQRMKNNLTPLYNKIKDGYNNISTWWGSFDSNFENLEHGLGSKEHGQCNGMSEAAIRSVTNTLPTLKTFNSSKLDTFVTKLKKSTQQTNQTKTSKDINITSPSKAEKKKYTFGSLVKDTFSYIDLEFTGVAMAFSALGTAWDNAKSVGLYNLSNNIKIASIEAQWLIGGDYSDATTVEAGLKIKELEQNNRNFSIGYTYSVWSDYFTNKVPTMIDEFKYRRENWSALDYAKKGPATGVDAVYHFGKGLVGLGEDVRDTVQFLGNICFIPGYFGIGKANGLKNEYIFEDIEEMCNETIAEIAVDECQTYMFDAIEQSKFGQKINDTSMFGNSETGKVFRGVSEGMGEVAGILALGAAFSPGEIGAVGWEITAESLGGVGAFTGFGSGAQTAAQSENPTTLKVFLSGAGNAFIEGGSWFTGAKINKMFRVPNASSKELFTSSLKRIGLDTATGAAESVARTFLPELYERKDDGSWYTATEMWKKNNGTQNLITNTLLAGLGSALGETTEFTEAFKVKNMEKATDSVNTTQSLRAFNEMSLANTAGLIPDKLKFFKDKSSGVFDVKSVIKDVDDNKALKLLDNINEKIAKGQDATISVFSTKELSSNMLGKIDDLDKVNIRILGGFVDAKGNIKNKYLLNEKYLDRVTYSGREALDIVNKIEYFQSKVDMKLPTTARARQIYEMLSSEVPVNFDGNCSHKVVASLRGLTANNANGKSGMVCAGFSQAYYELCQRCGINCEYVRGIGKQLDVNGNVIRQENHAWNVVIGENGEMIPVDVTWKACGQEGYFGPSNKFDASHLADQDEFYKYYSSYINRVNDIESIIRNMDAKYGKDTGIKALITYEATGNKNLISRNVRDLLDDLSPNYIRTYIDSLSSKDRVNLSMSAIKNILDNKYKDSKIVNGQISKFLNSGDINFITRENGARIIAEHFTSGDIQLIKKTFNFDNDILMKNVLESQIEEANKITLSGRVAPLEFNNKQDLVEAIKKLKKPELISFKIGDEYFNFDSLFISGKVDVIDDILGNNIIKYNDGIQRLVKNADGTTSFTTVDKSISVKNLMSFLDSQVDENGILKSLDFNADGNYFKVNDIVPSDMALAYANFIRENPSLYDKIGYERIAKMKGYLQEYYASTDTTAIQLDNFVHDNILVGLSDEAKFIPGYSEGTDPLAFIREKLGGSRESHFLDDDIYLFVHNNSLSAGFNNGSSSYIRVNDVIDDITYAGNMFHESLHQLSYDVNHSGFHPNGTKSYTGINESTTQLITKQYFPDMTSGYDYGVEAMKDLISYDYISLDDLKRYYYSGNIDGFFDSLRNGSKEFYGMNEDQVLNCWATFDALCNPAYSIEEKEKIYNSFVVLLNSLEK